jgi:fibronectin-binding autotransporter adhesin
MKNSFLTSCPALLAAVLALAQYAHSQTTFVGATNGTSQWTNTAIWSNGEIPNATDAVVIFTNIAVTNGVQWQNTNITLGTINFENASGNVVVGDNSVTNDTLTLATSSGKPVLNVSNSSGTAFMYASLLGTNGFTKTGAGNLTFRFNTTDMAYTGDINLNAGTLTIEKDRSLGDTNNDIIVGGSSALSFNPGANNAITLSAGRNISISNGTTLTLSAATTSTPVTINGVISNSGALNLSGINTGTTAATSLSYTFNAANTYSGATTVRTGTKVFLGAGASLSTNAVTFDGGSGSYYSLDLGGNTQNFANLTFGVSASVARTLAISNGTLNVTAPSGQFAFSGANGTIFDLSGLTAYSFNGATANRNFLVRPDMTAGDVTNTAFLAAAGIGSNNISAGAITIGAATGTQNGTNLIGRLVLGKANLLSATTMDIGAFNGSGLVEFGNGISGGSLVLRGSNGVSDMSTLTVGLTSSGARFGVGTLNLTGGSLDARATNINIGNNTTGLADTSSITMPDGTVVAQNLRIGRMTGGTSSPNMTNSFNQGGGNVTATNIVLGENSAGAGAPNILATYSNSGGTLYATTVSAGSGAVGGSTTRTIALNGASATLRNIAGADLSINGLGAVSTNRINVVIGASGGTLEADAARNITVGANALISGGGTLTKAGAGTLTINSASTHTGATVLSNGTIVLGSGAALSTNSVNFTNSSSVVNLGGNTQNIGTFSPNASASAAAVFTISNGVLNVLNPTGNFSFGGTNGSSLDMSNLTTFTWNQAAASRTFAVTPTTTTAGFNTNATYFARQSNSVTVTTLRIGGASGTSQGSGHLARLYLGTNNAFNSTTMEAGGFNGEGEIDFLSGVADGKVILRGTNGTGAMGTLIAGNTSSGTRRGGGRINLGVADALVTDTIVGNFNANNVTNLTTTNSISMVGGSFSSGNLYIGSITNTVIVGNVVTNNSSFVQTGGTSAITTIRMGDDRSSSATNSVAYVSTYSLSGAGAVLKAQVVDAGTNSFFGANSVRTLQLSNGGTLQNAAGANLSVTGYDATSGGRMNIALAGNGTVEADSGRTVTFGENTRLSGAGNLTKAGAGSLVLSSAIASTNTGALNINGGVLNLAGSGVAAAGAVSSVAVATNATLLVSQSNQVNDDATVSLSGGTISRGSGVSETFGALTLTSGSTLDFGTGSSGTLGFGAYTPTLLLTVQNFGEGNALRFGSNVAAFLPTGGALANSYFSFDNAFSYDSSNFTITAIPEPSTYLAAAGLIGLMLWPARRRLLRDARSILGRQAVRRF